MIPLKVWNNLLLYKRKKIVKLTYSSIPDYYLDELSQEYHHNFNYDSNGGILKSILSCCHLEKNGSIKVTVTHFI